MVDEEFSETEEMLVPSFSADINDALNFGKHLLFCAERVCVSQFLFDQRCRKVSPNVPCR